MAALRRHERERAGDSVHSRDQRDDDDRCVRHRTHECGVRGARGVTLYPFVVDADRVERLLGEQHVADRMHGAIGIAFQIAPGVFEFARLSRIVMRAGNHLRLPGLAQVDDADVGDGSDRCLGDVLQRLIVIEGLAEQFRGMEQEREILAFGMQRLPFLPAADHGRVLPAFGV